MISRKDILDQVEARLTDEWHRRESKESAVPAGPSAPPSPKAQALQALADKCRSCEQCDLYRTARNLVFSDGSPDARLVFVGEAPGADEDEQGKPFVGRAGKLLTATLAELGVPRASVYICNILKHRPPENRNPLPQEITACTPFLTEQLAILKPALIVTLGNFSTKFILNTEKGITTLRGRVQTSPLGYQVLPTYHPAAVLRNMNLLEDLKSDLQKAVKMSREG